MPRASLRSVLLICAESAAFICRVSTQITGNPQPPSRHRATAIVAPPPAQPACTPTDRVKQLADRLRLGLDLALPDQLAVSVHHADAGGANRHIKTDEQSMAGPPDRLNLWSLPAIPSSRHSQTWRTPEPQPPDLFYCGSKNRSIGGSCPLECRDHRGTTTPSRPDRERTELNYHATTKCSRLSIQALDIAA